MPSPALDYNHHISPALDYNNHISPELDYNNHIYHEVRPDLQTNLQPIHRPIQAQLNLQQQVRIRKKTS